MQPLFVHDLSEAGARRFRAGCRTARAPAGRRILCRGERVAGVYLMEAGVLRVFHQDGAGHQRTLYRLRPGDACVLAVNCTFSGVRYPADVEVEEDASMVIVDATTWRGLFETEPGVRAFTVNLLASWVFDLLGVLDATVSNDLPTRLADELLERMDSDGRVRVTHAALAAHLGTAREVVSRTLADWRRAGVVRSGRGWIEVVDVTRLAGPTDD
ncbi:MAG: Crp/Fnr family transcriptional regulator [Alphaproteobacteria bacterium]|nr:Crp/Fnr family transcriptional regulator [Alphaproteobacteria bacterium]